jgi:hypothetical protein
MSGVVADEAMKICRSAWLQGVWQSHPRHADLRGSQVYSAQAPRSTWQGHQARTLQGGLHSRRKIQGAQNRLPGLQEHTDLGRSRIQGAQLGWQGRRRTKILQDLGIKARNLKEIVLVSR